MGLRRALLLWGVGTVLAVLATTTATAGSDVVRDVNGDGRIVIVGTGSSNSDPKSHLPDHPICRGPCPGLPLPIGGRWYTQLADFMPEAWHFVNLAQSGMTARALAGFLPDGPYQVGRALEDYDADVVLIAIGVNDVAIECSDGDCSAAAIAADILALRDLVVAKGRMAFVATVEPLFPRKPGFHPVMPAIIADVDARLRAAVPPDRLLVHDDIVDPDDMTYADRPGYNDGLHPGDRGMRKWACDAATRLGLVADGGADCMPGPTAASLARTIERILALLGRIEPPDDDRTWAVAGLEDARRRLAAAALQANPETVRRELREAHRIVRRLARQVRPGSARALGEDDRSRLRVLLEPLAVDLATLRRQVDH
jgi:lysophospholipase L1-like esterase